jgi:SagB-type dehydrogenase family enzyme
MKTLLLSLAVLLSANLFSQELKEIKLNAPDKSRGSAVMKALSDRHSDRGYAAKELSLQDLSDLLWAANGINRPEKGMRTAPSAMNRQEIEVYVVNKEGTYLYDPAAHALKPLTKGDFRSAVASGQDFAATAPVCIVLAANLEKLGDPSKEQTRLIAATDGGIVNQNINIFCAATGLSTVPRATMNKNELKIALKLTDNHLLIINNPIGYPAK